MSMCVLLIRMSVYQVYAWFPKRPEKGVGSLGAAVTDSCEPQCGCWELNLGGLEAASALLCRALSPA